MPSGIYPRRPEVGEASRKDYSAAIRDYEEGMRIVDVARTYGIRPQVMGRIFKRRGIKIRSRVGPGAHNWKGGRKTSSDGYILMWCPGHARADVGGFVREHILIAERVFGKPLPAKAVVHHVNEKRTENGNENLVVCQNNTYHLFLHKRMRLRARRKMA